MIIWSARFIGWDDERGGRVRVGIPTAAGERNICVWWYNR